MYATNIGISSRRRNHANRERTEEEVHVGGAELIRRIRNLVRNKGTQRAVILTAHSAVPISFSKPRSILLPRRYTSICSITHRSGVRRLHTDTHGDERQPLTCARGRKISSQNTGVGSSLVSDILVAPPGCSLHGTSKNGPMCTDARHARKGRRTHSYSSDDSLGFGSQTFVDEVDQASKDFHSKPRIEVTKNITIFSGLSLSLNKKPPPHNDPHREDL